ncbi:MAG: outer membrane beta-barrel protein [Bacteroidota bacterium]
MKPLVFNLLICLSLALCPLLSHAQGSLRLQIGPTFATGDFGDDNILADNDAGGAGIGLGVGIQYLHPLSVEGLSLFGSLNINHFELKNDVKDDLESRAINNADVTIGRYFSIPLAAGLSYQFEIEGNVALFTHFGLALNFLKLTSIIYETNTVETSFNYDVSSTVGAKIGVGIFLNESLFVELNYYGLGEHDLDGEIENTGQQDSRFDGDQKVGYFTLGLGFPID